MTNNPSKRIRQHNGIIKGGAIKTLRMKNNEMYCIIKGFESKIEAMQAEWRIKHPDKKRKVQGIYNGIDGRIRGLNIIFADSKLTMNSMRLLKDMQLTIWLIKDKEHLLTYVPPNIKLIIVDKIDLQYI
jgi:predicted GIY-YIG superfamily endonuclease